MCYPLRVLYAISRMTLSLYELSDMPIRPDIMGYCPLLPDTFKVDAAKTGGWIQSCAKRCKDPMFVVRHEGLLGVGKVP